VSEQPAVDALTAKAMVVFQDRPVVPFTRWLADGLRVCTETGRGLQIVTPPTTRITTPLRLVLTGPHSRWVVRADGGFYDGLSGGVLGWDGAAFAPSEQAYAPAFTTPPRADIGAQLTVTFRVRHAAETMIGSAVEQMCLSLTSEPPGGWGTAEPATGRWRRDDLTELFRSGGSQALWLTVVGGAVADDGAVSGVLGGVKQQAVGTMLLSATPAGIEEAVTLVVGYDRTQGPPIGALPTMIGALALEHTVVSVFAQLSPGRADLTTEPRWVGQPAPIGMAVGAETGGAVAIPPGIHGQRIGDVQSPTVWYTLGDGWAQDGWQRYEQLSRYLHSQLTA
jgi:Family of unknown function (DUF6177)